VVDLNITNAVEMDEEDPKENKQAKKVFERQLLTQFIKGKLSAANNFYYH